MAETNGISSSVPIKRRSNVVVLDFGSQYTQLIARRIRELGVHSSVLPPDASLDRIKGLEPSLIILSGGPMSVSDDTSPKLDSSFFLYCAANSVTILGICYGLQLLADIFGGSAENAKNGGEYGRTKVKVNRNSLLYKDEVEENQTVWMSHFDEIIKMPVGFEAVAWSEKGVIVGIEDRSRNMFGVQYHPEVVQTGRGRDLLKRVLFGICALEADWQMINVLEMQMEEIKNKVGPDEHVICALSGGVDSTVAAVLVHKVIGDRLHCVFVDHGLLRFKEQERVCQLFEKELHLPVTVINRTEQMLSKLQGIVDPEKKRKIIGAEFIDAFEFFKESLFQQIGTKAQYLVQGTLYPDVIESCPPPGSDFKHSHTIKSHHNVGGLPANLQFKLIEPLKELFKDEVRVLGNLLGVPNSFIKRHPFPGPGLAVRIIGDVTEGNRLETLRLVDEIFVETIKEFGLYDKIWQAFAVFLPIRSVGVQGDARTHAHVVCLRAVTSSDGMTADWYAFEPAFLREVSSRICNQVKAVNRVVYDITSKPPGTIEWE